jgi:hypothetical protein
MGPVSWSSGEVILTVLIFCAASLMGAYAFETIIKESNTIIFLIGCLWSVAVPMVYAYLYSINEFNLLYDDDWHFIHWIFRILFVISTIVLTFLPLSELRNDGRLYLFKSKSKIDGWLSNNLSKI